MPFDEPIDPHSFRDRDKLDSAVNRAFHTFDGNEFYPTLAEKAAVLFHSIACSHSFINGNKRTAVMAVDMFLTANECCLLINNEDVYELAKETVEANRLGRKVEDTIAKLAMQIGEESLDFAELEDPDVISRVPGAPELHEILLRERDSIRQNPLNGEASD